MSAVSHALARHLPAPMLGLGDPDLTPEAARDRLAAIGQADPETGHMLADNVMATALHLIASGHAQPDEIARFALVICSAEFPRWSA